MEVKNKIKVEEIVLHNGYILCEEVIFENKTESGIYLSNGTKKDGIEPSKYYKVLNIDKSELPEGTKIKVKVGDIVSINSGHYTEISGKKFMIIKQGNIVFSITE